jgi:hypothetical protein
MLRAIVLALPANKRSRLLTIVLRPGLRNTTWPRLCIKSKHASSYANKRQSRTAIYHGLALSKGPDELTISDSCISRELTAGRYKGTRCISHGHYLARSSHSAQMERQCGGSGCMTRDLSSLLESTLGSPCPCNADASSSGAANHAYAKSRSFHFSCDEIAIVGSLSTKPFTVTVQQAFWSYTSMLTFPISGLCSP